MAEQLRLWLLGVVVAGPSVELVVLRDSGSVFVTCGSFRPLLLRVSWHLCWHCFPVVTCPVRLSWCAGFCTGVELHRQRAAWPLSSRLLRSLSLIPRGLFAEAGDLLVPLYGR